MAKSKKKIEISNKKPSLKRIAAEINKKFGSNIIGTMKDMSSIKTERFSSGIKKMDDAIGGGYPTRRIVELYGVPSGGKSLISLLIIASAQKKKRECVYIDVEDSFDPAFATKLGVNMDDLIIMQSSIGESTLETVCSLLAAEPGVIVIDSVAAMITQGEMDEGLEKAFMAPKARLMSKALAKINALNKDTLIIFINQLRSTLTMYGPPTTTTGGRSLAHYASIRVEVKKADKIFFEDKKTKPVIGQVVAFNVTKNKTAIPFRTGSFKFFYEDGHIEE